MRYYWLNNKKNEELIIFFNGWGMDEKSVQHLDCGKYDVITFFDYTDISIDKFNFDNYKGIYLIAWSMGVFMSNFFKDITDNTKRKIAINGTLKPIDDNFGIPVNVFDLTACNFNDLSSKKFMKRMFLNEYDDKISVRTTAQLKQELISIKGYKPPEYLCFDTAVIADSDKIIPSKNQLNFWNTQIKASIISIKSGHYPFFYYNRWKDILNDQ